MRWPDDRVFITGSQSFTVQAHTLSWPKTGAGEGIVSDAEGWVMPAAED